MTSRRSSGPYAPRVLSTETRFDVALVRCKSEDSPLARPFGRQTGEANNAHAVGKPAVDRGLDEIGREERERKCPVHSADARNRALLPCSHGGASSAFRLVGVALATSAPTCDDGKAGYRRV
jgi:hypothetical protein